MHELVARVRAVLRRMEKQNIEQASVLHRGEISLDQSKRLVTVNARRVDLTPSEFDILVALMTEPGRVFSRQELLDRLQGGLAYDGFERMINVHISNLRNKIEPDPSMPRYIETVYGAGYRFNT
jgi:two-component system OmpR family response regulator